MSSSPNDLARSLVVARRRESWEYFEMRSILSCLDRLLLWAMIFVLEGVKEQMCGLECGGFFFFAPLEKCSNSPQRRVSNLI